MLELVAPSRFRAVVLIATRDDAATITAVVQSVRDSGWRCIVVDDGSQAVGQAVLDALAVQHGPGITRLRLPDAPGPGAAMAVALREAHRQGYSHAVQIGPDLGHDTSDVGRFVARARRHPTALICGCPPPGLARRRGMLARGFTRFCVALHTLSFAVSDAACGFRVYPVGPAVAVLDDARLSKDRSFDVELLVKLHRRGVPLLNQHTRIDDRPATLPTSSLRAAARALRMHARLFGQTLRRSPPATSRDELGPGGAAS